MGFTEHQLQALRVTERVCSCLSIIGAFIIITTFLGSVRFRKPINRLVFYASWGNIMSNVATLISLDGIDAGVNHPLCRFQAFLIQWFIIADPFWTLAMAINVYFTFFRKYDAASLRNLEWKYLLFAYGLNLIPALTYLFVSTKDRGPIYGSATLWCWISNEWDFLRVAAFYAPIWTCILLTMAIYIRAGRVLIAGQRAVQKLSTSERDAQLSQFDALRTTEIHVTTELATDYGIIPQAAIASMDTTTNQAPTTTTLPRRVIIATHTREGSDPTIFPDAENPAYTVNVETEDGFGTRFVPLGQLDDKIVSQRPLQRATKTRKNAAARAYTKYAMLYFVALLVTWVPSSINRVYSLVHPDKPSYTFEFIAATVLPLQGFWQTLIYIAISWSSFQDLGSRIRSRIDISRRQRAFRLDSPGHTCRVRNKTRPCRISKPTNFVHITHFNCLEELSLSHFGLQLSQDAHSNIHNNNIPNNESSDTIADRDHNHKRKKSRSTTPRKKSFGSDQTEILPSQAHLDEIDISDVVGITDIHDGESTGGEESMMGKKHSFSSS